MTVDQPEGIKKRSTREAVKDLLASLSRRDVMRLWATVVIGSWRGQTFAQYQAGLAVIVAWLVAFFVSPSQAAESFYGPALGMIAFLLGALIFQARWFRSRPFPRPSEVLREREGEATWNAVVSAASEREGKARADYLDETLKHFSRAWSRLVAHWLFRFVYALGLLVALIAGALFDLAALMADDVKTAGDPQPVIAAIAAGLVGVGIWAVFGSDEEQL